MTTTVFIITSNDKTPQSLRSQSWIHLLGRWNNWWQFTQGGSEVRHQCSLCSNAVNQTIVGGASVRVTSHRQTARFEKGVKILIDKQTKKKLGGFINIGWLCTLVMHGWWLYPRGPGVIRGLGGLCNKKYIRINCRWVVGGWDKSLVMQIFSKIWTCFKWFFSSGRQIHR